MENKKELALQTEKNSCKAELTNDQAIEFINAMNKMALALNIKLEAGTVAVWEQMMIADFKKYGMALEDFLDSAEEVSRNKEIYKVRYSDLFTTAREIKNKRPDKYIKAIQDKRLRERNNGL